VKTPSHGSQHCNVHLNHFSTSSLLKALAAIIITNVAWLRRWRSHDWRCGGCVVGNSGFPDAESLVAS